jgi:hypothetical protein
MTCRHCCCCCCRCIHELPLILSPCRGIPGYSYHVLIIIIIGFYKPYSSLQVTFLGPAYLLYLLQPKLAACSTQLLLTASPLHRLGRLDNMRALLQDWAGASSGDCQLALLAYARQLAGHLREYGVTATAVDVGEQYAICTDASAALNDCMQLVRVCLSEGVVPGCCLSGVGLVVLVLQLSVGRQGRSV